MTDDAGVVGTRCVEKVCRVWCCLVLEWSGAEAGIYLTGEKRLEIRD